jgi:hypothetical protein
MRDVMVSYDNLMAQYCWECFMAFFRIEKGYEDWTDEQIALSVNQDDIDEFCKFIKDNLSYDRKGEE